MTARTIQVYTIRRGPSVYVGQTRQKLADRLRGHRSNPSNRRVHEMLTDGLPYVVEVESTHRCERTALAAETALIEEYRAAGDDVLNRFTPGREGAELSLLRKREREAKREWIRCCLCRRRRDPDDYYRDTSRSNGKNSRCRECSSFLVGYRLQRPDLFGFANTSEAYRASRAEIEAWRDSGYVGRHPKYRDKEA